MKILFIDNAGIRKEGDKFYCEPNTGKFASELQQLGNDITLFGQIVDNIDEVHKFDLLENNITIKVKKRKRNKIYNYICLYLKVLVIINKFDFIYIFYPNSFKYIALIAKIFNVRYGLYIRGEKGFYSKTSQWIYKNSSIVFTISEQFTQYIKNISQKTIALTVRPMISYTNKDIEYNRNYNRSKNVTKILFLARITFEKGIKELLNAINILNDKGYNIHLTIVGDGEDMCSVRKLVNSLSLNNIVTITGAIYNNNIKKEYFLNSDLYILPTYHEGFPRTLYEAMIFGTPIITTFVGTIPFLMKDEYNCKKIQPQSIDSIIEVLEFAINNPTLMEMYARNAIKTVESIFDSNRLSHAEELNMYLNSISQSLS